jgi:hypothetical protein
VQRLVPLAKAGDLDAAVGIHQFVNNCRQSPKDEAQLARWLSDLRDKRLITFGEGGTMPLPRNAKTDT